jgi:hypothetical protein
MFYITLDVFAFKPRYINANTNKKPAKVELITV